jgi:hypothetical protein
MPSMRLSSLTARAPLASIALAITLVLAVPSTGCKSSPDRVCGRLAELMAQKLKKEGISYFPDDRKRLEENCIRDREQEKTDSPELYECTAKCINDAKEIDAVDPCMRKCPKPK